MLSLKIKVSIPIPIISQISVKTCIQREVICADLQECWHDTDITIEISLNQNSEGCNTLLNRGQLEISASDHPLWYVLIGTRPLPWSLDKISCNTRYIELLKKKKKEIRIKSSTEESSQLSSKHRNTFKPTTNILQAASLQNYFRVSHLVVIEWD